jgi:anti-anti-sigma factor
MYTASLDKSDSYRRAESLLFFSRKEKRHLESLLSVTKTIASSFHLDELLEKIMDYAVQVTGAERGFLFLYNEKQEGLKLEKKRGIIDGLQNERFSYEKYKVSSEIIQEVEKTGEAIIGSQEESTTVKGFNELKQYGIKQAMYVPLRVRGKTLGFLYLDNSFTEGLFGAEELELMKSFATLTSISIENAYLMSMNKLAEQKDRNITITIEPSPSVPNLKIISIEGSLDSYTTKHVNKKVLPVIEEASNVILDLRNVGYISKTGIACLINYFVLLTEKKRLLKLIKPPQHVYDTLVVGGLAGRFDIYDSIEAAISSGPLPIEG